MLHPECSTFVGRKPIAQAHGMTVGELTRMFNAVGVPGEAGRSVPLGVVELAGWSREMYYEDTGLPWVPPSPNMPTVGTRRADCRRHAGHGRFPRPSGEYLIDGGKP